MTTLNAIEMVYPPSPKNEWMAERLKKELDSYRIPAAVRKKTGIQKISEVKDPALVVFCMPESIGDPEVEEAISRFTEAGLSDRIIALILGGPPGNRFPQGLLHKTLPDGTVVDREPLAANISAPTRREMLKKLETEKLRIIASVLGVAFDDLRNRRRRQQMRIAAAAGTVLFCGAAAFLFYALSRVRVMSGQQAELTQQLEQARAAEKEEEKRKNEEDEALAGTIAVQAREALESGDSELALLLCREFLPEMERVDALTKVFRQALEKLCGQGYVPVTDGNAYGRNRYGAEPSELFRADQKKENVQFPEKLYPPVPEGLECEKGYAPGFLKGASEEFGCAVYLSSFTPLNESGLSSMRVHFPQDPERGYYLKDRRGEFLALEDDIAFLPDGSFLGVGATDGLGYRVRIADGEILPFYDAADAAETESIAAETAADAAEAETIAAETESAGAETGAVKTYSVGTETETGGMVLPHMTGGFHGFDGSDVVFGFSDLYHQSDGYFVDVYSASPFRYLETLENMNKIQEQKGMNYLFGSRLGRIPVTVFRKAPFSYCFTLKTGSEEKVSQYPLAEAVRLPDGREILLYEDDCVYSLPDGKLLYDFHAEGFAGDNSQGEETAGAKVPRADAAGVKNVDDGISSEGWFSLDVLDEKVFWDAASGQEKGRIPFKKSEFPMGPMNRFYGPEDPESGRLSASAYCMGGIVWEYREHAREVPGDLEGQLALAEEFLQGRTLTKRERDKYHLD